MITATSEASYYRTRFTNGKEVSYSDTTNAKDGSQAGFRPHELLEAALANCMNITARMYAERHSIPLAHVSTLVEIDRGQPGEAAFKFSIEIKGSLSEAQRQDILNAIRSCPVRSTLSRKLSFHEDTEKVAAQPVTPSDA